MKRSFSIALLLLASNFCPAQGFYFRGGLGYAFPQAGQTLDGSGTGYNGSSNNSTLSFSIKGASFSAGAQLYAGFGYLINKNVGVQLDVNAGLSPKTYTFTIDNYVYEPGVVGTVQIEQKAVMPTFVNPALVIQSGGDKINCYSRFGPSLPVNTKMELQQLQTKTLVGVTGASTTEEHFSVAVTNSFSIGFAAAAGVQYKLNDRTSLWGEFSILSSSVYIKRSELTAYSRNGLQYSVANVPAINYTKSGTLDTVNQTVQMTYSQPFSNIGINVGVSIKLGGSGKGRNSKSHSARRPREESDGDNNSSNRPRPSKFK